MVQQPLSLFSLASNGDAEVLLVVKNKRLGYFCGLLVHCRSSRGVQILHSYSCSSSRSLFTQSQVWPTALESWGEQQ